MVFVFIEDTKDRFFQFWGWSAIEFCTFEKFKIRNYGFNRLCHQFFALRSDPNPFGLHGFLMTSRFLRIINCNLYNAFLNRWKNNQLKTCDIFSKFINRNIRNLIKLFKIINRLHIFILIFKKLLQPQTSILHLIRIIPFPMFPNKINTIYRLAFLYDFITWIQDYLDNLIAEKIFIY